MWARPDQDMQYNYWQYRLWNRAVRSVRAVHYAVHVGPSSSGCVVQFAVQAALQGSTFSACSTLCSTRGAVQFRTCGTICSTGCGTGQYVQCVQYTYLHYRLRYRAVRAVHYAVQVGSSSSWYCSTEQVQSTKYTVHSTKYKVHSTKYKLQITVLGLWTTRT
jgi:hypothetical protein